MDVINAELNYTSIGKTVDVDLDNYYTKEETDALIPDITGFALKTEIPDVSKLALKTEIPDTSGFALKTEIPDTTGFATEDYVNSSIENIQIPKPDLTGYATERYVNDAISAIEIPKETDLSNFYNKQEVDALIPDTSEFITMPEVEQKGYQTEEQVNALIASSGSSSGSSADVFVGASPAELSASIVPGSTGWTAVEITNETTLLSVLSKGLGKYYIGTNNGKTFGAIYYGSIGGTVVKSSQHLGTIGNIGLQATGSYDTGYNYIEVNYSADGGKSGLVPAPAEGDMDTKWLNSDGTWKKLSINPGTGLNSETFNNNNSANGEYSHAEGFETRANASYAHAEGYQTQGSLNACHAEGYNTWAFGNGAHAEGYNNSSYYLRAMGEGSHIEGYNTSNSNNITSMQVSGSGGHVEGYCNAVSNSSQPNGIHIEGAFNIGSGAYQHIQGKCNISDAEHLYADIVGNGSNGTDEGRSNAFTLDWNGNATYAGTISSAGADYAEYFEWLDGNPEEEDRVGYIVKLNGNKIEYANDGDDIIGVVSGTMTVLGDNAEWYWNKKYLTDDFGRVIYEEKAEYGERINRETGEPETVIIEIFTNPVINPEYDVDMPYLNRRIRPEWDAVGMMGKLYVRDDGTAQVNGYVTAKNGIATASTGRTNMRVMERVKDNIIRVLLK